MTYMPHYEVRENASPVDILFVHGNLASKHWWYPVTEIAERSFRSLNSQRPNGGSMVLCDLRGSGRSINPTPGRLTVDELVEDLIRVTEATKLQNVFVVGHSAGGLLTALLLARRPDLFKKAILIDPVGPTGLKGVPADIEARYAMMTNDRAMATQIIGLTIQGNDASKEFFQNEIMDDTMIALNNTGISFVRALEGIDYSAEIKGIKQPMTVFYGGKDWVLEEANATDYVRLAPQTHFVKMPENGHCLNYENPERLFLEMQKVIGISQAETDCQTEASVL